MKHAAAHPGPNRRLAIQRLGGALLAPSALLAGCATTGVGPDDAGSRAAVQLPRDPAAAREAGVRLVNRLTWGASDADLDRLAAIGAAAFAREQLSMPPADRLPATAQAQIDAMSITQRTLRELVADTEALRKRGDTEATVESRKAAQEAYQRELTRLAREAASRHLLRALYSPSQLHEQMTWFWFNHFNVHQYKANIRALLGDDEERAIRPHAIGSFRTLLGAATRHPAMLRYLDNDQNAAGRINENHARELLELHTLGVDGGYTQRDVQEVARVLTGHGVNFGDSAPKLKRELQPLYVRDGAYEFNPARHDFGDKTVLGRTIKGSGAGELDAVLDLLAAHPATARFVSRKLAVYLLADKPPQAVVDSMAAAWAGSNGSTAAALAALVRAPEFTAPDAVKFKEPVRYVVSALRAAYGGSRTVVASTAPAQNWLNRLGEGLYNRQTPDGYPLTADAWNSSGQMATRFEVARAIGSGNAALFRPDDAAAAPARPAASAVVATAMATVAGNATTASSAAPASPAMSGNAPTATSPANDPRVLPQLSRSGHANALRAGWRHDTLAALDGAASAQDWNTLYLASPDFMFR